MSIHSINSILSDDLIRHDVSLLRFDAKLRRQIKGQLRVMQDRITAQLSNVDFSKVAKRARLTSLLEQVDGLVKQSYKSINSAMLVEMQDLAALEQSFASASINKAFGVDIVSGALTPQALKALAKNAPIMGAPAAEWWGRQSARMRNQFADQMRTGFLLGETTGDLVRRVRGTATGARQIIEVAGVSKSVAVFSGGIMDLTTREAETLVRTSVQSITNAARLETYKANTDVIGSLMAQVTLDTKTSDICQAHGAIPDEWTLPDFEPVGGSNSFAGPPPWHFNCRSSLLPITKSWEQLQQQSTGAGATQKQRRLARKLDNNAPKRTRQSADGLVPRDTGYDDWLRTQNKAVQLEVLGPGKRELWKAGKLNLTQTLDQTGRPLTLHQLANVPVNKPLPLTLPPRRPPVALPSLPTPKPKVTASIPPPTEGVVAVTVAELPTLEAGTIYRLNGEVFKVLKKTKTQLESVHWSTRTGKFVSARNKTVLKFGPVEPPPTIGGIGNVPVVQGEGIGRLKSGDIFKDANGVIWKVEMKLPGSIHAIRYNHVTKKFMSSVTKEFKFRPKILGPKVGPDKLKPFSTFVDPENYRTIKVGDVWRDAQGNVWKAHSITNRGVKGLPWSVKSGRYLSARNGKVHVFGGPSVRTFVSSTATTKQLLDKTFIRDAYIHKRIKPLTSTQLTNLDTAIEHMSKNGFGKGLARLLTGKHFQVRTFNMGIKRLVNFLGGTERGNFAGAYWHSKGVFHMRALGMAEHGTRQISTWVHEFGHHLDFTIMRNFTVSRFTSTAAQQAFSNLKRAHTAMITEYESVSALIGKRAGINTRGRPLTATQQKNNWQRIQNSLGGDAQSSYSLANQYEWFAESHVHYYSLDNTSRAFMKINNPATYEFFQLLNSSSMDIVWKELQGLKPL